MSSSYRLVFRAGFSSKLLSETQLDAALCRILGLAPADLDRLRAEHAFTPETGLDETAARNLAAALQKLGLDVLASPLEQTDPAALSPRWLSESGLSWGFTRTQLDMERATSLLRDYTGHDDTPG